MTRFEPRRWRVALVAAAGVLLIAGGVLATPQGRDAFASVGTAAFPPPPTADPATLTLQGQAVERAIGRSYAKAIDQLKKTRELRLPIEAREADEIEGRGVERLREVRRAALVAVAETFGLAGADRDRYAASAEARLEAPAAEGGDGVLLAPRLGQIARRAGELCAQIADETTRALTQPVPAASPSPAPRASPSPVPRASPSPTGR